MRRSAHATLVARSLPRSRELVNREVGALAILDRLLQAIPPASGAVVMGAGIVSIDLVLGGYAPAPLATSG